MRARDGHNPTFEPEAIELEPTPPDVHGNRWRVYESTGNVRAHCSCGLDVQGPHSEVIATMKRTCITD